MEKFKHGGLTIEWEPHEDHIKIYNGDNLYDGPFHNPTMSLIDPHKTLVMYIINSIKLGELEYKKIE